MKSLTFIDINDNGDGLSRSLSDRYSERKLSRLPDFSPGPLAIRVRSKWEQYERKVACLFHLKEDTSVLLVSRAKR